MGRATGGGGGGGSDGGPAVGGAERIGLDYSPFARGRLRCVVVVSICLVVGLAGRGRGVRFGVTEVPRLAQSIPSSMAYYVCTDGRLSVGRLDCEGGLFSGARAWECTHFRTLCWRAGA